MAWSGKFDEDDFEWPLVAEVESDYLQDFDYDKKDGGWQSLIVNLLENEYDGTIDLYVDDVERILRYAYCYRNGGFQSYLRSIFIEDAIWNFAKYHYCDNVGNASPFDDS